LQQAAGVESHFTEFVAQARASRPEWIHTWLNPSRTMHPFFAERLRATLAHSARAKYWGPVKLPRHPASIRAWHCRSALRRAGTDVLLIWNRSAGIGYVLDAARAERCIHWEHGAAWDPGHERERRDYFRRVPRAIANSSASARVLQLLWGYEGTIRVCRNALRPSLLPPAPVSKRFPSGKIRLGVAARLYPVKGVAVALHALRALRDRSLDAELEVAGAGPELDRLRALAGTLGVTEHVRFHGALRDMEPFYRAIDCLVHTPVTEAFGLVVLEAAAFGCPVLAAAVDGLPEAVANGVSGQCVTPSLALRDYASFGGSLEGLPPLIYEPTRDALAEPRIVDPADLAAAVARLFGSAREYEEASAAASEHVLRTSSFDGHVREVMAAVAESVRAS
jgi:glycosyltransferase involved in cell wall biosynthesis